MCRRRKKSLSSAGSIPACSSLPAPRCPPNASATHALKSSAATCRMCTSPGIRGSYRTTRTGAAGTARYTAQSANPACKHQSRTAARPAPPCAVAAESYSSRSCRLCGNMLPRSSPAACRAQIPTPSGRIRPAPQNQYLRSRSASLRV